MKVLSLLLGAIVFCSVNSFAVEFKDLKKGDRVTMTEDLKLSEALGRGLYDFPAGYSFTILSSYERIRGSALPPFTMLKVLTFRAKVTSYSGKIITRRFEITSFNSDFDFLTLVD